MEGEELNEHQIPNHSNLLGDQVNYESYDDQPVYDNEIDFLREGAVLSDTQQVIGSDSESEHQPETQQDSDDGDDIDDDDDDPRTVPLSLTDTNQSEESVPDEDTEIEEKKKRFNKNVICSRCGKKGHSVEMCLQPKT